MLWSLTRLSISDRDSLKEVNSLHLPSERFSPVRRASDGIASLCKYQNHLESLYDQTLARQSGHSSLLQIQQECQQLQKQAGSTDAEKLAELQQQHTLHRQNMQVCRQKIMGKDGC